MDRDEHTKTRDRRRLAYEPLCLISAVASMEGYGPGGGVAGSGHVETLCCKSRTRIGLRPLLTNQEISRASTALFLLLPVEASLAARKLSSCSSQEDSVKQEDGFSVYTSKLSPGRSENKEFNESEDVEEVEGGRGHLPFE
ncbi:hypothetical protein HHK36_022183 [Tetracentron sinense]|uniref:Uncharacterized protein n=1 Tax=Tetracentron sinense TaxID=13715 RepID=A0A834YRH3_TETSI|nr:hypothetical protein HHK36_022183 [Tetracentron sinense]